MSAVASESLQGTNNPNKNDIRPFTGQEFLSSLDDGREIWLRGEKIENVVDHPAFRNSARMLARMYDALHDPATAPSLTCPTDTGNGGFTHAFFKVPRSPEEVVQSRYAIAEWAKVSYGWMGRSPDYKASFVGTLGANADFYEPYQENAKYWYKKTQERCYFLNHAIINPPVDKSLPLDQVKDVFIRVEKETDAGLIVSGAKVVATGSALTHYNFIGFYGPTPMNDPKMALFAMLPMDSKGLKLLCRHSYELNSAVMGSPFDYPLSSRLDENDSILVLDKVLIPWENMFVYNNIEKANGFFPMSGFIPRFTFHGLTRFAVKLDFLTGLMLKATEAVGISDSSSPQVQTGEMIGWRNTLWALGEAMCKNPESWVNGTFQPNGETGLAYRSLAPTAYARVKQMIQETVSSGLIYLNGHAADFKNPELKPYIDRYLRGSNGYNAEQRVKLLKLMWDAVGTEFGGRHELYERNYAGNYEKIRQENLLLAQATGTADELKGFVDKCLAEYDLDGWRAEDLINPSDVSLLPDVFKNT